MNLESLSNKTEEQNPIEIMPEMMGIQYQNSLVLQSLEEYNKKYEILNSKFLEHLNQNQQIIMQIKSEIEKINAGNDILNENLNKSLKSFKTSIESMYEYEIREIQSITGRYIKDIKLERQEIALRQKNYIKRGKITDYLIKANLSITPILFIYILYMNFFK